MVPTESQRMAARRALEWIGTLKARLVFRYEISDSLMYVLLYINKKNVIYSYHYGENTLVLK